MPLKLVIVSLAFALTACNSQGTQPDQAPPESTAGHSVEEAKATTDAPFVDGQLIVHFQDGIGRDQVIGLITRRGDLVLRYEIGSNGSTLIEINSGRSVLESVHLYRSMPEVEFAEPNFVREERGDN
jgi:Fervidolysin N-terminal prodomain